MRIKTYWGRNRRIKDRMAFALWRSRSKNRRLRMSTHFLTMTVGNIINIYGYTSSIGAISPTEISGKTIAGLYVATNSNEVHLSFAQDTMCKTYHSVKLSIDGHLAFLRWNGVAYVGKDVILTDYIESKNGADVAVKIIGLV